MQPKVILVLFLVVKQIMYDKIRNLKDELDKKKEKKGARRYHTYNRNSAVNSILYENKQISHSTLWLWLSRFRITKYFELHTKLFGTKPRVMSSTDVKLPSTVKDPQKVAIISNENVITRPFKTTQMKHESVTLIKVILTATLSARLFPYLAS